MGKLVAALYIDPGGPYPAMEGVDSWDAERDADYYPGPYPVVAHPPCGPWGKLRRLATKQMAHHGMLAVGNVRRFGGVLEHPQGSGLWGAAQLPTPSTDPDAYGGVSIEVDQVRWGHVARKRTWLYIVGCSLIELPPIPPLRTPTHWISGSRKPRASGGVCPPHIKFCSSKLRRITPPRFAEWLCAVAASCRVIY